MGLIAYFSDRWKEAWALTVIIAFLTAASSKASVWIAETSGELVNSIAFFHDPRNMTPLASLLTSAGMLVLLVVIKDVGFVGIRHLISATFHRKWRGWLDRRFNEALLDGNHTHFHLQHAAKDRSGLTPDAPDNIDQRIRMRSRGWGGAIGLAMGAGRDVTVLVASRWKLDGGQRVGVSGAAAAPSLHYRSRLL